MASSVLLLPLLLFLAAAEAPDPRLRRLIERGQHPAIRWGDFRDVQQQARALYERSGWTPLWLAEGRPTAAAAELVGALLTVADRGLRPADYDAAQLAGLGNTLERRGADSEQAARFDAALTIAALRVVDALAHGRVPPRNAGYAAGAQAPRFAALAVVEQLRRTGDPGRLLTALEPRWPDYRALRRGLAHYRALWRDSVAFRLPHPGPRLAEGSRYRGAAALRLLLGALGDLDGSAAAPRRGDSVFTAELADGLRRFQARQGGPVDGRLSEATLRTLGTHVPRGIRQLELALERWRWLPRGPDLPPILVTLPARRLSYEDPGDSSLEPLALRMRAERSRGCASAQPVRAGMLQSVLLRPAAAERGSVLLPSGDAGLFLHGARPEAGFLDADGGCIWLADAETLAEALLRRRGDWSGSRIRSVLAGKRPVHVSLRRSVPLLVVYSTAVARENGQVFFYPDALGLDRALERRLAAGYPYR